MKQCVICKQTKDYSQFRVNKLYRKNKARDLVEYEVYESRCDDCRKAYYREHNGQTTETMTDEKRCRECGQYKPITEYYSEYRQVKYPSGRIGRKIFYKHKCKACTCAKRKTYIKDNKPKKSVYGDMAWAFSDKLEGVFYNRKRVN